MNSDISYKIPPRFAMPYRELLKKIFSSRTTLLTTVFGTGSYVSYTDYMRYNRMLNTYREGNIICPFLNSNSECEYFHRPELESCLHSMLESNFSNEYYFVRGEVGSGKSRSLVEIVRELMRTSGANGQGAPVYVLASQGKNFTDTLAEAVRFRFDEHVNFTFFLSYLLGIDKFPSRDESHKLIRVLDAIEKSACMYSHKYGKPAVLIIDGSNILTEHLPGSLEKLQEKAKLWADVNVCKVIFVSNEEKTEERLMKNASCWSRVGTPLYVDDMAESEAVAFLGRPPCANCGSEEFQNGGISGSIARDIYRVVGGRIQQLLIFKRDALHNVPFHVTKERLITKEREKFIEINKTTDLWKLCTLLLKQPGQSHYLCDVVQSFSKTVIDEAVDRGIVKLIRTNGGVIVEFESKLTENAIKMNMLAK